jgi:D-glycero-D-manno-heptose 1,7-bisphosphate phosphatase
LDPTFQNVRYVFLDREGVICRKPPEGEYIRRWEDFHLLPGAEAAIASLNRSGRRVIVVTNQRGVALGRYTCAELEELHSRLQQHVAMHGARIDAFYYCPHDNGDQCDCRKPKPGLFQKAFRDFGDASAENSLMIGDSISDIEGARELGMASIFIRGELNVRKPGSEKAILLADRVCNSLQEAVGEYLL